MTEHSAVHLHCESNPYLRYCILAFYEDREETQRLEAAHHKWLRRILNISWKDMVRNESIQEQTIAVCQSRIIGCDGWERAKNE